jgi:aspartate 1-decarboxylase
MQLSFLKSKIHRAIVTETDIDYNGSISVDSDLLQAAQINEFERVEVYNITNGQRFATYAIKAEAGSGKIGINGAAAHLVGKGDLVIICCYCILDKTQLEGFNPRILLVDKDNKITNG